MTINSRHLRWHAKHPWSPYGDPTVRDTPYDDANLRNVTPEHPGSSVGGTKSVGTDETTLSAVLARLEPPAEAKEADSWELSLKQLSK